MIGGSQVRSCRRIGALIATVSAIVVAQSSSVAARASKPYAVGYGTGSIDPRVDPWIAVTDAMVRPLLTRTQRRTRHAQRLIVDYDGDGVPDEAVMVRNHTQIGVLVRLGRTGRKVLAYRADGHWGDQSLHRSGRNSISIEFPESSVVVLSCERGTPIVYFEGDDEP